MPRPSPSRPSRGSSFGTAVAATTKTQTRTKIIIGAIALAAFGLAAYGYGFGFLPSTGGDENSFFGSRGSVEQADSDTENTEGETQELQEEIVLTDTTGRPVGSTNGETPSIAPGESTSSPLEEPAAAPVSQGQRGLPLQQQQPTSSQDLPPEPPVSLANPAVVSLPISYAVLTNGELELQKFKVYAQGGNGSIAIKQFMLSFEKSKGLALDQIRLYKGYAPLPLTDYSVTCLQCGPSITPASAPQSATSGVLVITYATTVEELIPSNSPIILSVRSMVSGVTTSSALTVGFKRDLPYDYEPSNEKGVLLNSPANPSVLYVATKQLKQTGYFVWSDLSDPSHNAKLGKLGGSTDWYSDAKINPGQKVKFSNY